MTSLPRDSLMLVRRTSFARGPLRLPDPEGHGSNKESRLNSVLDRIPLSRIAEAIMAAAEATAQRIRVVRRFVDGLVIRIILGPSRHWVSRYPLT